MHNCNAVAFVPTSPLFETIGIPEYFRDVRVEFGSVPETAERKSVLLPWPIDIAGWQFGSGPSTVFPRARCKLPSPDMFRWIQPNQRVSLSNRLRQKARAAFQYPRILFKLACQSSICLETRPFPPAGSKLDRIEGNHGNIWPNQSQSLGEMAFPDAVCSGDDDLLQSSPCVTSLRNAQ